MQQMLMGAIAAGSFMAGLFFARFWRKTGDRLFLYFAASFWLEGVNRLFLGAMSQPDEQEPLFYLVRLLAYGLILAAIWQKNRGRH